MNDLNLNAAQSGPGRLADYLAELLKRLRHFSGPMEFAPELAAHLARIKVLARLLVALDRPFCPRCEGFIRLGGVLEEWVTCFESGPELFPFHLTSPFERLADYLEELLLRRDRNVPLAELDTDDGWAPVLASFQHAGTPLSVLEDVENLLVRWECRWTDENLTPVQKQQLLRRWTVLRERGDILFGPASVRQDMLTGLQESFEVSPTILLLVDSAFRRDEIRDKLIDRGYGVEIAGEPVRALELLDAGLGPRAVLCDDLEPTRHLTVLREGMSRYPGMSDIPLVLVVGGSLTGDVDQARARSLGAVAVWGGAFRPADLERILQRLSQP